MESYVIGNSASTSVKEPSPADQITRRLERLHERLNVTGANLHSVVDNIIGSVPEATSDQSKGQGVGGGLFGRISSMLSAIEDAASGIEEQANRLSRAVS